MSVGKKIRDRRKELGLSQSELARMMGYNDRSTIAKIESEKNHLTEPKIKQFAEVLNTTPEFLMDLDQESELDRYNYLITAYCRGIASWSGDKLTTIQDQAVYRMHFAELLLRYKLLLEKSVNIRFTSKHYLDSIKDFNESREHPLSKQELTKQYLDQELENEIDSLTSWIKTITLYLSKDGKEPDK